MGEKKKNAALVGIMVIVGTVLFVVMLAVLARWKTGEEGFTIDVQFDFLNNLATGAPVKISGGIPVGYVESIYQKDLKTFVRLYLNNDLKGRLPKRAETQFAIYTTGLMGQKYINVTVPEVEETDTFYEPGDKVKGIDPPSIDQMMLAFSSWFDGKNGGQVLAEIMKETRQFIANLNEIVGENRNDIRLTIKQARTSFTNLSEQLNVLMAKLNVLSANFTEISSKNKRDIQVMLANMSKISRDLNLITQRVNSGRGSVGKFVSDEALYHNANQAVINAKELFRVLKEKPYLMMYKEN